jgi:hypothetical protein
VVLGRAPVDRRLSLYVTATAARKERAPWCWHWYGLAAGFALMSIDEVAGLHETFNMLITGTWVVPALLFVAAVVVVYGGFIFHLPRRTRLLMMGAGAVYFGGALGIEHLSNMYAAVHSSHSV